MRIACIDKTAADRVKLQQFLDNAYAECRDAIGHISLIHTYPVSKDELLLNKPPQLVVVGPAYAAEEAYTVCREIRETFPSAALFLVIDTSNYSLRTLKRFQRVCNDIFSSVDTAVRIIHTLSAYEGVNTLRKTGKLIAISGVKGGVGTTTVTSGLAHAAEALGKTAVVIDLSPVSALVQYMATKRWQCPEFTAMLVDGLPPEIATVQRCLSVAPNGITVLLPPSGGTEVRELWLRDRNKFEVTLGVIEILKDLYDVVIVDTASVEGVLAYALTSKAHARLLVTSNDPASVHLLNSSLAHLADLPGHSQIQICINLVHERGLRKEDILDFLYANEYFHNQMALLEPLPYDARGRNWIGTGNTFYTECSNGIQKLLEDYLTTLLLSPEELAVKIPEKETLFSGLKFLSSWRRKETFQKALPLPEKEAPPINTRLTPLSPERRALESSSGLEKAPHLTGDNLISLASNTSEKRNHMKSVTDTANEGEPLSLYEPPQLTVNEN